MTLATPVIRRRKRQPSKAARARFPAERRLRRRAFALGLGGAVLGLAGATAMGAGVLIMQTPWPVETVVFTHAVQTDVLFLWGGFGALALGLQLVAIAARRLMGTR